MLAWRRAHRAHLHSWTTGDAAPPETPIIKTINWEKSVIVLVALYANKHILSGQDTVFTTQRKPQLNV